jgi:hypothetical protein
MKSTVFQIPKLLNNGGILAAVLLVLLASCRSGESKKSEELRVADVQQQFGDLQAHSIADNTSFNQLASSPSTVLLTGNDRFRLVTVYKTNPGKDRNIEIYEGTTYSSWGRIEDDGDFRYFMPGMDVISGYNLVNIGHYDVEKDTLTYFFAKPVLIKNLYFPGLMQDSLYCKPVSRNYYMVSVYDEDTNSDSLINRHDLRRMYHFDEGMTQQTPLLPPGYSAIKSNYEYKLDAMYIYARFDENGNGTPEKTEPVAVFMLRLYDPTTVRRVI